MRCGAPRVVVWSLLAAGCAFDSSGQGDGKGQPPVTTVAMESTSGAEAGTSGGPGGLTSGGGSFSGTSGGLGASTGGEETSGPVTLTADASSGETTLPDPGTTTLPDPTLPDPSTTMPMPDPGCLGPMPPLMVLAKDAQLEFPMVHEQSQQGEGTIASSGVIELGTAEFKFDVPCADDYAVWARVYDGWDGTHNSGDPDSYYAKVNGADEFPWFYGCQTFGADEDWGWRRVRSIDSNDCNEYADWTLPLMQGSYYIRLRNREGERGDGIRAAVARVILSNDPNFVPTTQ